MPTGDPFAIRTRSPQPLGHSVQLDNFTSTGPRPGCGIQGQFWLQIDVSSSSFHGTGVNARPDTAPALQTSRSRRENFMPLPSLVTTQTTRIDMALAMAILAVAHLHAVAGCAMQTRHGMPPDIAAVSADAVDFIDSSLVRVTIVGMALAALELSALHVNRVREPQIRRLTRINEPGCFVSRLDVAV